MNVKVYYIDCLTNLHVGSGEANFNIVDKEVEKDPLTGYPMVHASGIKGAFREAYAKDHTKDQTKYIFGEAATDNESDTVGSYKFFDAHLLYRPMRAEGSFPFVNVTTITAIENFVNLTKAFGVDSGLNVDGLKCLSFENAKFLTSDADISVESEVCAILDEQVVNALRPFLGEHFAIAASMDDYSLPVVARNRLHKQKSLWYEEFVPYGSRFYMLAIIPDGTDEQEINEVIPPIAQIGGNCSVGYGYCKIECKFSRQEA